ncbi:MAG: hypothetical protein WC055_01905 [Melioribacteraceae bacterium]
MRKSEKIICDFIHDFVDNNYSKINIKRVEDIADKESLLKEVNDDFQVAMWVLTEICQWGMDKVYLKELYVKVDSEDYEVLKINDTYIKITYKHHVYHSVLTRPKYKRVMYF